MKRDTVRIKREGEEIDLGELSVMFHADTITFVVAPGLMGATISDPIKLIALRNRISLWEATRRKREKDATDG